MLQSFYLEKPSFTKMEKKICELQEENACQTAQSIIL